MSEDTQKILTCIAGWTHDGVTDDAARAELAALVERAEKAEAERDAVVDALRIAVRQNAHDMMMTGEELRICEAAIAKATGEQR